jgi:hypothetical protein
MPIDEQAIRTTIITAASCNGFLNPGEAPMSVYSKANYPIVKTAAGGYLDDAMSDQHAMQPPGRRQSFQVGPNAGGPGDAVTFYPPTGHGDAVYLPFKANNICSAVLPADVNSGVTHFFTAPLSGCTIFIDEVTAVPAAVGGAAAPAIAVGDLVVYHANALSHCASQAVVQANPAAAFNVPARNHMRNTVYNVGRRDYVGGGAGQHGLTLQRVGICEQGVYMKAVWDEMARKRGQGRTHVTSDVGTNVIGIRNGNAWEFWFQTWGWVNYQRPFPSAKMGRGFEVDQEGPPRIWDAGCCYRG